MYQEVMSETIINDLRRANEHSFLDYDFMIFGDPGKPRCVRSEKGEWGHWLSEVTGVPAKLPHKLCEEVRWGPRQAGRVCL